MTVGAGTPRVDAIIAGAQKSGTTSLFRYLGDHPRVTVHPQREMNYFLSDPVFEQGWERAFDRYFAGKHSDGSVIVAKHVMLMYSEKALDRLWSHNPDIQVIVCLRDPVERAYSAYWYARRRGWETIESFEDAVAAEAGRIAEDGWEAWKQCAYLHNGRYAVHVANLLRRFGREQVSVALTEDLERSPRDVCDRVLGSLGLEMSSEIDLASRYNTGRRVRFEWLARGIARVLRRGSWFKESIRPLVPDRLAHRARDAVYALNEKRGSRPRLDASTKRRLSERFTESNRELGRLIGRDLSHWERRDAGGGKSGTGNAIPPGS